MNVKLTRSGNAVRTNNLSEVRTNSNGVISSFSFEDHKYKLFTEGNRLEYLENGVFEEYEFRAGYYKVELYNEYMEDSSKTSYLDLKKNGQFRNFAPVKVGDYLEVNIIRYEPPYNDFLLFMKYEVQVTEVDEVYTLNGLLDEDKFSAIILRDPVNPGLYASTFYANHISYLGQDYDEDAAIEFVKLLVRTSLRLQYVHDEILPILLNLSGNCEDQSVIETAVDEIKASWQSPDILSGTSIKSLASFYKMIGQLQRAVFRNQNILSIKLCEDRLFWLFHLMPVNVLKNFTYDRKLKVLLSVFENEKKYGEKLLEYNAPPDDTIHDVIRDSVTPDPTMAELHQRFVAKMFFTFKSSEADQILDFLLIKKDGEKSYFEIFYYSLSDAIQEDINFVEWFVDQKTNKAYYCKAIYELWLTSRYNPYYAASASDLNQDGINLTSYWMDETKGLNDFQSQPNKIIYTSKKKKITVDSELIHSQLAEFFLPTEAITKHIGFKVINNLESSCYVIVHTAVHYSYLSFTDLIEEISNSTFNHSGVSSDSDFYGRYHLYHPIALTGYLNNSELEFPSNPNIPAFLYFHAEDFDRIKDFAAGINLAIDLTIETITFFGTGGLSMLRHFRHLKYMTKWWKVNQLNPSDVVMYWKAFGSIGEALSIYASTVSAFLTYNASLEDNPAMAERYHRINMFFLLLSFGASITPNKLSKTNKISASHEELKEVADDIISEIDLLDNAQVPHGYPQEIEDLARTVRAGYDVSISEFEGWLTGLTGLLDGSSNNILAAYQGLSGIKKYKFLTDFKNYSDDAAGLAFWNKLNETSSDRLDQWEYLVSLRSNREVRTNINILDDVKTIRNIGILDSSGVSILDDVIEWIVLKSSNPLSFKFVSTLISRTESLNEKLFVIIDQLDLLDETLKLGDTPYIYNKIIQLVSNDKYLNVEDVDRLINGGFGSIVLNEVESASNSGFLSELYLGMDEMEFDKEILLSYMPTEYQNSDGLWIDLPPNSTELDLISVLDEIDLDGIIQTRKHLFEIKESGRSGNPDKSFKRLFKAIGTKFNDDLKIPSEYRDQFDKLIGVIDVIDGPVLTQNKEQTGKLLTSYIRKLKAQIPQPSAVQGLERMSRFIVRKNGNHAFEYNETEIFNLINPPIQTN